MLLTGSFTRQTAWTKTPALYGNGNTNIPRFNSNVNMWLFSTDYTPRHDLAFNGTLQYSWAHNFNDYSAVGVGAASGAPTYGGPYGGIPYGADYDQVDLTTGLTWTPKEDTSIKVEYGFYYYQPDSNWNAGDYNAHLISLEVSKKF